jgi:hypothetical protein
MIGLSGKYHFPFSSYPMYASKQNLPQVFGIRVCNINDHCKILSAKEHRPMLRWHLSSTIHANARNKTQLRKIILNYSKPYLSNKNSDTFKIQAVRALISPNPYNENPYEFTEIEILEEVIL